MQGAERVVIVDFVALGVADVERVQGGALFGGDAGVGGVEVVFVDGVEEVVHEADAVDGLDLDDCEVWVGFVIDEGTNGERHGILVGVAEVVGFGDEVVVGIVAILAGEFVEFVDDAELLCAVFDGVSVGAADSEDIEDDAVAAGVDVGGEDVDFFRSEGAAEFLEEEGAVFGDDGEFGVAVVGAFDPLHGGFEQRVGILRTAVHVLADGADMGGDVFRAAVAKVSLGHLLEMAFEERFASVTGQLGDLVVEFGEFGADFGVVLFVALFEEGLCGAVELDEEGFLPGGPRFFVGAVGVDVGEEEEVVEKVGLLHEASELGDDFGVLDVLFGGEAPEGEVVIDEEHDQLSSAALDEEASAKFAGQHGGAVDVFADVFGAAGVVENEGEVEGVGVRHVDEYLPVASVDGVVAPHEGVELVDAAEGVFVGGVAVKELVLHEAFEGAEFGEVAAEESGAVHEAEDAGDFSFLLEDVFELVADALVVAEALVDEFPVGLDEFTEFGGDGELVALAVPVEAHEAIDVLLENLVVLRVEAAVFGEEVSVLAGL